MPEENVLICVVGPTAIGKTALATALANYFNTQVLSADSRQFYREMRIGTAVPTAEEMAGIPHHFIQHISIHQEYTVGDFESDALDLLRQLFEKRSKVIMVGGSGLYIDAVVQGLDKFPAVPAAIRESLRAQLEIEGLESLVHELKRVDPLSYQNMDLDNPHRVLRALEIYRTSGRPISDFWGQRKPPRPFKTIFVGLTADRETIYRRIEKRVDNMLSAGLEEEARSLYAYRDLNALQTVGYREFFAFFDGKLSREAAIAEIKKNSRRYAKRQGTWFRKNQAIEWFDYRTKPDQIAAFIEKGGQKPPSNT